jgi:ABC-2 type transport system ATP-binding protein
MGPVGTRAREPGRDAAVDGRGLGYRWGRSGRGIERIDLRVEPSEVLGVLGPNGAGKSTLLGLLATLLTPAQGELRLLGVNARRARPALRRRIGYAGDEPAHFGQLSGRANAVFFARAAGLGRVRAEAAVAPLLERFGLRPDAERRVREYSYGMRRKLLLCEAFAADPALALLDEPTLGLDAAARDALAAELRARSASGAAVVLATNDLPAAAELCTHVLFLDAGRAVLAGAPRTLLAALGAGVWIEVALDAAHAPAPSLAGVQVVVATPQWLRARATAGAAVLPALCGALLEQGCAIRDIRIRSPDLRDVYEAATGVAWAPSAREADA